MYSKALLICFVSSRLDCKSNASFGTRDHWIDYILLNSFFDNSGLPGQCRCKNDLILQFQLLKNSSKPLKLWYLNMFLLILRFKIWCLRIVKCVKFCHKFIVSFTDQTQVTKCEDITNFFHCFMSDHQYFRLIKESERTQSIKIDIQLI
jgi:hypothetical protein